MESRRGRRARPRAAVLVAALLIALTALAAPGAARAQEETRGVSALDGTTRLIDPRAREALRERLQGVVFRAEALHPSGASYRPQTLRYDGAVTAITHDGALYLVTSAGWVAGASEVLLIDGERRLPLEVERVDARYGLALLRPGPLGPRVARPLEVAGALASPLYTLLSPGDAYELFADVAVIGAAGDGFHWVTSLTAINGYPLVDGAGRLVGVQHRRIPGIEGRGLAIGPEQLGEFLSPREAQVETLAPTVE